MCIHLYLIIIAYLTSNSPLSSSLTHILFFSSYIHAYLSQIFYVLTPFSYTIYSILFDSINAMVELATEVASHIFKRVIFSPLIQEIDDVIHLNQNCGALQAQV